MYIYNEEEDSEREYPRSVQFRLGLTTVYGLAELFHEAFPHVLRVSILPHPWDALVRWLVSWLPFAWLRDRARALLPGPFLPPCVAVKKLQKLTSSHVELFEDEKKAYSFLRPLQGAVVPRCYGEAACEGRRALVLSVVDGTVAALQQPPHVTVDEFKRRIEAAAAQLRSLGVVYDDKKLDNVVLIEDRAVLLDLEYVWACAADELDEATEQCVDSFVYKYNDYLRNVQDENAHPYHMPLRRRGAAQPAQPAADTPPA